MAYREALWMLKKDDHEEKEDSKEILGKNESDENVGALEGEDDTEEYPGNEESAESEGAAENISDMPDHFWRIPEGVGPEMFEEDSRNYILLNYDSEDAASYSHWPPNYEENAEESERDPSDSSEEEDLTPSH